MNNLTCQHCNNKFITSKRSDTKYCSDKCQYDSKSSRTDRTISYQKNKETIKAKRRNHYRKVKDSEEYKDKARIAYWQYSKKRLAEDINYKLKKRLRTRLHSAIKIQQKSGSAIRDLGCTVEELKTYLEKSFYASSIKGMMTWANYGEWHIDHKTPLCKFDLSNAEELKIACHYTNLQPLWKEDHIKKTAEDNSSMSNYESEEEKCSCDTGHGSENRKCSYCRKKD